MASLPLKHVSRVGQAQTITAQAIVRQDPAAYGVPQLRLARCGRQHHTYGTSLAASMLPCSHRWCLVAPASELASTLVFRGFSTRSLGPVISMTSVTFGVMTPLFCAWLYADPRRTSGECSRFTRRWAGVPVAVLGRFFTLSRVSWARWWSWSSTGGENGDAAGRGGNAPDTTVAGVFGRAPLDDGCTVQVSTPASRALMHTTLTYHPHYNTVRTDGEVLTPPRTIAAPCAPTCPQPCGRRRPRTPQAKAA